MTFSNQTNNENFAVSLNNLLQTVQKLRGPEGCPWDKAQTHASLATYAIEEAYELTEVLDKIGSYGHDTLAYQSLEKDFIEELGDYLFQVLLHCEIKDQASNLPHFKTLQIIAERLNQKLIHRHPHVFTNNKINNIPDVWKKWEEVKLAEKNSQSSIFTHPKSLPALQASAKIGQKAKTYDFDWQTSEQVVLKIKEELLEVEQALVKKDQHNIQEEIGDLLFSVAQLARHTNIDPEQSLRSANAKFINRFMNMIKLSGLSIKEFQNCDRTKKESLWKRVKALFA